MKYSVILPCRNEQEALGICIKKIRKAMSLMNIEESEYEIIVSDSSTDNSPQIAKKLNTRLVKHNKKGYGIAYLEGFKYAKGEILILGDCDDTYDFLEIPELLKYIDEYDLVLGKRKYLEKDAMPFLNRYVGNPVLSGILRLFFKTKIKDAHTGFRAIKRKSLGKLNLKTIGMEFASEMIMQAIKNNLKIKETPIHYYKRKGKSKLNKFPDGWRHLRFMLLYSPLFLFFIPGASLFLIGLISLIFLYFDSFFLFGIKFFYHPMFLSSLFIIIGYQLITFAFFSKTYAMTHLNEKNEFIGKMYNFITIEKASLAGIFLGLVGVLIYLAILIKWIDTGFGQLQEIKNSIVALTLIILGIQTVFSSFMLSILGIKQK